MRARWGALAATWGFAEATLFFLVPDVVITLIALRFGFRQAWIAAAWAALGAVLGGIVVYVWARHDPAAVDRVLDFVPAVSVDQIARAKADTAGDWVGALMGGAFVGNPYKLYAAAAGQLSVPLIAFIPMSFLARIIRFLLAGTAARVIALAMTRLGWTRWRVRTWAACWIAFYAIYLSAMPW